MVHKGVVIAIQPLGGVRFPNHLSLIQRMEYPVTSPPESPFIMLLILLT